MIRRIFSTAVLLVLMSAAFIVAQQPTTSVPATGSAAATSAGDVTGTAIQAIKASPGNVYGWYGYNPNTSVCYLQFYNNASGGTLGTNALHPFGVAAGASFNIPAGTQGMFNLSTGITTGEATTATGGTGCSSAMPVTILYE